MKVFKSYGIEITLQLENRFKNKRNQVLFVKFKVRETQKRER